MIEATVPTTIPTISIVVKEFSLLLEVVGDGEGVIGEDDDEGGVTSFEWIGLEVGEGESEIGVLQSTSA